MKQIYCFLILIIFVFILYDIKLIEGNDHEYDTTQDSNVAYQQSRGTEDSFFDKLGITNLLPKEYSDTISISNTDNLDQDLLDEIVNYYQLKSLLSKKLNRVI